MEYSKNSVQENKKIRDGELSEKELDVIKIVHDYVYKIKMFHVKHFSVTPGKTDKKQKNTIKNRRKFG